MKQPTYLTILNAEGRVIGHTSEVSLLGSSITGRVPVKGHHRLRGAVAIARIGDGQIYTSELSKISHDNAQDGDLFAVRIEVGVMIA